MNKLAINVDEQFQHLPHAPIVEAVIDIRARPAIALEEGVLRPRLEEKLVGYKFLDSQRHIRIEQAVALQGQAAPAPVVEDLGWKGFRFQSDDQKHIAQFNRDGFVFSRLEPYQSWQELYEEAMRLWEIYKAQTNPAEIHRLGLRYINRVNLPAGELQFEDYMEAAPATPRDFETPFYGFMHQDTLAVPDHPYAINVIKTLQPPENEATGIALILDIDVFTIQGAELDQQSLGRRLLEMRWLKNKVFFGSITQHTLQLFL